MSDPSEAWLGDIGALLTIQTPTSSHHPPVDPLFPLLQLFWLFWLQTLPLFAVLIYRCNLGMDY